MEQSINKCWYKNGPQRWKETQSQKASFFHKPSGWYTKHRTQSHTELCVFFFFFCNIKSRGKRALCVCLFFRCCLAFLWQYSMPRCTISSPWLTLCSIVTLHSPILSPFTGWLVRNGTILQDCRQCNSDHEGEGEHKECRKRHTPFSEVTRWTHKTQIKHTYGESKANVKWMASSIATAQMCMKRPWNSRPLHLSDRRRWENRFT